MSLQEKKDTEKREKKSLILHWLGVGEFEYIRLKHLPIDDADSQG